MKLVALSRNHYDNYMVVSSEGIKLGMTSKGRADWYLSRGLAEVVSETPIIIRLLFTPSGYSIDPYSLEAKEDICVVCGSEKELTKHHVVPLCFRRHFPNTYKLNNSHDILLLCTSCHLRCEKYVQNEKQKLLESVSEVPEVIKAKLKVKAMAAAKSLYKYGHKIPGTGRQALLSIIEDYLGVIPTSEEVERMGSVPKSSVDTRIIWKEIVDRIEDLDQFVYMWRRHFVEVMSPQYLPKLWSVENPCSKD